MENYIGLKFGTIKEWYLNKNFCDIHKKEVKQLNKFYDNLYKKCTCVFTASEKTKKDNDLKNKMCDILDIFFDLGCKIYNCFENKTYKNKQSYRKYILDYGKEIL